jgi:SAM-dependent methyltransferase
VVTACPACTGPLSAWRRAPAAEPGGPATYLLLRCAWCGSAATAERAPADAHVTGGYAAPAPRGAGLAAPLLRRFDARRLALLGRPPAPGAALLDVGAGRGRFVAAARAAGWDARGIEPFPRGVAPHVEAASVDGAEVAPGSLDAVTLWHVLEHLDDPEAALRRIRGWLAPDGVLLVGVPDLASLQARLGGPRWYHLDLPRHRTHFTLTGIEVLLGRAGFRVERSEHRLLEHNPFGMWQSLVSRVTPTPSWLYGLLKRTAPVSARDALPTLLLLPLAPPALLLERAAGAAHRGGTVAVRATPR